MSSLWTGDMVETFYFAAPTGTDKRGDYTYAAATSGLCRFEATTRMVRTTAGDMVAAKGIIRTESAVTATSRVWIPGTDSSDIGESMMPLQASPVKLLGSTAVDHYIVYV